HSLASEILPPADFRCRTHSTAKTSTAGSSKPSSERPARSAIRVRFLRSTCRPRGLSSTAANETEVAFLWIASHDRATPCIHEGASMSQVYYSKTDDPQMAQAIARAVGTFKYLWRELTWEYRRIVPALGLSAIKAAFKDPNGGRDAVEHMWLSDLEFDG